MCKDNNRRTCAKIMAREAIQGQRSMCKDNDRKTRAKIMAREANDKEVCVRIMTEGHVKIMTEKLN
jgi:hypothetical protein